MKKAAKWTIALSLSLAAHAAAAIVLLPDAPPPPLAAVEGGEAMEVALLGNAFEDAIEAGAVAETVTSEETPPEEVAAIAPDTAVTETLPLEPTTAPEIVSETPPEVVTPKADVILPADAVAPLPAEQPEVVAALPPVTHVVPQTRPEPREAVQAAPARKPPAKTPPPRKQPQTVTSGKQGQSEDAARKGREDGSEAAAAQSSGKGTRARAAGNASFSNYEGKVHSKLRRALRYPSRAEAKGAKGVVQLQFLVSANGAVSGVKVVKSGGSPVLDKAAVEAAERAAPFPKIPGESGKSSWLFLVPLDFRR
jgi:protein TonB